MGRPVLDIKAFGGSFPTSGRGSSRSGSSTSGSFGKNSPYFGSGNPTASRVNVITKPSTITPRSSSSSSSSLSDYSTLLNQAIALSQANSAFNASEARKNREWQEYMSNTAHQREVADLKAAGLNPILSVTGGNGAPVGSGATAYADSSGVSALGGVISSILASNATLSAAALASSASRYASELSNPLAYIFRGASSSGKNYADRLVNLIEDVLDKVL